MKDLNYVVGRLHGLNELVEILKDLADKKGGQNQEMIAVLADHIAEQLQAIIRDFDKMDVEPEQRELLSDLKEKHMPQEKGKKKDEEEEDNREKLEKHERTVDDLLRDLESLKS